MVGLQLRSLISYNCVGTSKHFVHIRPGRQHHSTVRQGCGMYREVRTYEEHSGSARGTLSEADGTVINTTVYNVT
jgi:hypothetical protein